MNKLTKTSLLVAASIPALASASALDSRSLGMGQTGVASASYLSSSFHNPSLAARYKDNDDFGLLITAGIGAYDPDGMLDSIDEFQTAYDNLDSDPSNKTYQEDWVKKLGDLDGSTLSGHAQGGMVIAIPNKYLATNFFMATDIIAVAKTDVDNADFNLTGRPSDSVMKSYAQIAVGGTVDLGLTLAREMTVKGQTFYLGVSPKYQTLMGVHYKKVVNEFDEDDDSEFDAKNDYVKDSAFNIDIGTSYTYNNFNVGFTGKNLIKNELKTNESSGSVLTYSVEPIYTLGAAYSRSWVTVTGEVELNEHQPFVELDYKEQFARVGLELDAWEWAQFRLGYSHSMTDSVDDTVTAGLGFKFFGSVGFDIGAKYGKDDNYGASAQFVAKF